jgi:hypothetical protein
MTSDQEHRAEEAKTLLANEIFGNAMATVRLNALAELATADATNAAEILRLQAIANCTQEVRDLLYAAIIATGEIDGGITV